MALVDLDDSLRHQISSTFDHVGPSDHRFYDRHWFGIYHPTGQPVVSVTMGLYNNMNTIDAGCAVIRDSKQYNLRLSRELRPDFDTQIGPLQVSVVKPLQELRLRLAQSDGPIAFDIAWRGVLPPEEEIHSFQRVRGRVTTDTPRFWQIGTADGWITVSGERIAVADWFAVRDHSWGVRGGVGLGDPVTGESPPASETGRATYVLAFFTETLAGHIRLAEGETGRSYATGVLRRRAEPDRDLPLAEAELRFELFEGTRRVRRAELVTRLGDGTHVRLLSEPLGPSIAMPGIGYGNGWNDGQGLGAYRGKYHAEQDVWDVSHPGDVVREDGTKFRPPHRIVPAKVTATFGDSSETAVGSMTFMAEGRLPQYGLS